MNRKDPQSLNRLRKQIQRMERRAGAREGRRPPDGGPGDSDDVRRAIKQRLRRDAESREGRSRGELPMEAGAIRYARDVPVASGRGGMRRRVEPDGEVLLEDAVAGQVVKATDWGDVYVSEEWVSDAGREHGLTNERFLMACEEGKGCLRGWLGGLLEMDPVVGPEDLVFFDLETTGLGSSPLFLIGAMVFEDGGLVVRQYLARDYSEEGAAMALFAKQLEGRRALVSFNGKSFDAPFLRARSAALAAPFPEPPGHLDLLHVSRRRWKGELPNCRLQTLEHHLCGRLRDDDVPSHLIPEVYHEFVRTGNAWQMAGVMKHNKLDLITLAQIMVCLAEGW